MTLYRYKQWQPKVGENSFLADSADIIGRVTLGENTSVWYGCVLRGDVAPIVIGDNCNIQDLSLLHVTDDLPLKIGKNVTIGHKVVLHSCEIGEHSLIGMGAIILDKAKVGANSLVAAGSVIPPGKEYPPGSFIIGSPAKVKRSLTPEELTEYGEHYRSYLKTKDEFITEVERL